MRATDFEFRWRFVFIGLLFAAGFWCYRLDRVNAADALQSLFGGQFNIRWIFVAGTLFTVAAAALRTWATAYLRTDVVQDQSLHTEQVVADGPYRHCRNPLYVGSILLSLGFGFLASRIGCLVMVAGNTFFVYRLIGREEAQFLAQPDSGYRAYFQAVPRLWPSLRPCLPAAGGHPRWGQALLGELPFWLFAAAAAAFAATLNVHVLIRSVQLAVGIYLILFVTVRMRTWKKR
jgi:protein-S-isoprenylcysteine O-methyltransferase Ste14